MVLQYQQVVVVVVVALEKVAVEKVAVEKVAVVRELLWKACTAVVGGVCCIWAEHAVEQLGQHETLGQTEPPVGFCCVLWCCCWLAALRWWRLVEVLRWVPWVLVLELVLVLLLLLHHCQGTGDEGRAVGGALRIFLLARHGQLALDRRTDRRLRLDGFSQLSFESIRSSSLLEGYALLALGCLACEADNNARLRELKLHSLQLRKLRCRLGRASLCCVRSRQRRPGARLGICSAQI